MMSIITSIVAASLVATPALQDSAPVLRCVRAGPAIEGSSPVIWFKFLNDGLWWESMNGVDWSAKPCSGDAHISITCRTTSVIYSFTHTVNYTGRLYESYEINRVDGTYRHTRSQGRTTNGVCALAVPPPPPTVRF